MRLVVFDIDGTLTDTNFADGSTFLKTFEDLHGLSDLSTDWGSYEHSTDSGIVDEVFRKHLNRAPSTKDLFDFVSTFVKHLISLHAESPQFFLEVPGAREFLLSLKSFGWLPAIATGAWKKSAVFKLGCARLPYEEIPAAFAEDAFERHKIIEASIDRAKTYYNIRNFDQILYVGDGEWDRKAAKILNIPFVHRTENDLVEGSIKDYCNIDSTHVAFGRAVGLRDVDCGSSR